MLLPPGPALPAWQQAQAWIENPIALWRDCAAQYGHTFTIQLGSIGPTVLFSRPESVRQVFQLSPACFECRQFNQQYGYLMGENSLLVSDGPEHRRKRRMLQPVINSQRHRSAALAAQTVASAIEAWPEGQAFSVRREVHEISLRIMLGLLFGPADSDLSEEIERLFATEIYKEMGAWGPWSRFSRLQPLLRQRLAERMEKKRREGQRAEGYVFDALVFAPATEPESSADVEIEDHIFTILIAGVDPVALALSWALHWVSNAPAVQKTMTTQLRAVDAETEPHLLARLPYLTAVCEESLRMVPVVTTPSGRKLVESMTVDDRTYPAGTTLLPCPYLVHRDEATYPEPDSFRPERFLERSFAPYEYMPFGGGNRVCLGASLAMAEMTVALAMILKRWDLKDASDGPVHPVRHGTLLAPSDNMRLVAVKRHC